MKKKHRKTFKRMNTLLHKMLEAGRGERPVSVLAASCAVLAITYKCMDEDERDAVAPIIKECMKMVTEDNNETHTQIH